MDNKFINGIEALEMKDKYCCDKIQSFAGALDFIFGTNSGRTGRLLVLMN
jgi:hypothetical protein